jgi:hypothetical protein
METLLSKFAVGKYECPVKSPLTPFGKGEKLPFPFKGEFERILSNLLKLTQ